MVFKSPRQEYFHLPESKERETNGSPISDHPDRASETSSLAACECELQRKHGTRNQNRLKVQVRPIREERH
jgi:hypothetical protein